MPPTTDVIPLTPVSESGATYSYRLTRSGDAILCRTEFKDFDDLCQRYALELINDTADTLEWWHFV